SRLRCCNRFTGMWCARRPVRYRLPSKLDEMLAVIFHLFDGFMDVGQRLVARVLDEPPVDFWLPAARQLLQGADIQVAIVEERLEFWHVAHHEAPILPNGVAAQG